MDHNIATTFVHGYSELDYEVHRDELPALWTFGPEGENVHRFPFPRNPSDFRKNDDLFIGPGPLNSARDFKKLPRFGLTGIVDNGDYLFAGSWNGVYRIRKSDFQLDGIITNHMMNDLHGIWVDTDYIVTILTGKDTIIFSDFNGEIVDHFTVCNDLTVKTIPALEELDWRFLSKQFRGATGLWHFNFVQRFDDELWLTSRNLNAFVVVNLKSRKAHLRTMNQKTVVLLHDGVKHGDEYFFTSIDGKIIIAAPSNDAKVNPREYFDGIEYFSRDLVCDLLRLEETKYGRQPNWCRGIACWKDQMFITIDGRYGSDLSFGVLGLTRSGEVTFDRRLRWKSVGSERDLRYVTGFDIVAY